MRKKLFMKLKKLPFFRTKGMLHDLQLMSLLGFPVVLLLMSGLGQGYSVCIFYNATSLPCPGCGLTRSVFHFMHLDFAESLYYHPFGAFAFFAMIFFAGTAFSQTLSRFYERRSGIFKKAIYGFFFVFAAFGAVRFFFILIQPEAAARYFYPFDDPSLSRAVLEYFLR